MCNSMHIMSKWDLLSFTSRFEESSWLLRLLLQCGEIS
jgi:hypothetical protein